jgi:hypothetical protein
VVQFIVRSVDEILKTEFGIEDGLASTITWGEMMARKPELKLPKFCTTGHALCASARPRHRHRHLHR